MRQLRIIILIIFLLNAIFVSSETISGYIKNQNGKPMSAVVIEQKESENYALSNLDGYFSIDIKPAKKISLTIHFVGYFTRNIDIPYSCISDTLHITMLPGEDDIAKKHSFKFKNHLSGFAINLGYCYIQSNFDAFSELTSSQISTLNENSHYAEIGISGYIYNIYAKIGFGLNELKSTNVPQYRHLNDSYTVSFKLGYCFNILKNNLLIITPYLGVNHLLYNEYIAPANNKITLEEYLQQGYVDYNILQYTGNIGVDVAVKLFSFGKQKRQGIYLNAGVAYNGKLNNHPYISSRATKITTSSIVKTSPVTAHISIEYMISTKPFNKK